MPMRMHTYRGFNRINDVICGASNDYCSELSIDGDGDFDLACMCDAMECDSILVPPPPMGASRMRLRAAKPSPPTVGSRLSRLSRKSPMLSCRLIAQSADRMDDIDTYKQKKKSVEHHYITKALKCFLLSVLFPIQLSGLPLPIICAAARLLLSSPKTSFSALTLFRK